MPVLDSTSTSTWTATLEDYVTPLRSSLLFPHRSVERNGDASLPVAYGAVVYAISSPRLTERRGFTYRNPNWKKADRTIRMGRLSSSLRQSSGVCSYQSCRIHHGLRLPGTRGFLIAKLPQCQCVRRLSVACCSSRSYSLGVPASTRRSSWAKRGYAPQWTREAMLAGWCLCPRASVLPLSLGTTARRNVYTRQGRNECDSLQ